MSSAATRCVKNALSMTGLALLAVFASQAPAQTLAERYPPRVEELRPTSGWAPQFQREIIAPDRARVPLGVDWADNEVSESAVTFGVPFARGALADAAGIRIVDADGRETPAEFRVTATWDGPDGPVRWVLGHAVLQRGADYFIEYGTAVARTESPGLSISETAERVVVDTGAMRVALSRSVPSVLESVQVPGAATPLVSASASGAELPRVVDAEGVVYTAGGAGEGLSLEVVETGPGRAAVRREGWYTDAAGNRFCKFVTYTYFQAGQASVRHDHTLIVAFDSNEHMIRDIMLPVPVEAGPGARAVFAGDESPGGAPIELPAAGGPFGLVQKGHDAWDLLGPDGALRSGSRAGGWFGLAGQRGGAFGGLRDFWQQYPGELAVDGQTLRFHLWPSQGVAPLDFRPSSQWQLGDEYPGDHVFHSRWYRDGLDEMTQAYGVAKTHNLFINFFAGDGGAARRLTRAQVLKPVLALPDPDYVCSTEAFFGRMHPHAPDQFPEIEALIQSVVDTYYGHREQREQYGWIHFGDVHNTGGLWRRWGSMFYGFVNVMPRLYLRSGRRETWDFHRVNARHVTDIDICHLDHEEFRKEKGRRYGGDGGIAHFAADLYDIGCDSHLEFMLMDYYLNGNLRILEVARYYLDANTAARGTDSAMIRYQHRHTGGALRLFSEAYQAFWDPEHLSIMRQCADILYEAQEQYGSTRYDDVYMNPAKILYYQLTGEERMRELFLNDMDVLSRRRDAYGSSGGGRAATLSGLAHAYWFTGDEKYLPFLAWQIELVKEDGIGGLRGNFLARYATHGYQLPQAMALLAEVDELPEPKGPAVPEATDAPLALQTNWATYLLQEEDADFSVTVDVNLYRGYGRQFHNRSEWLAQLDHDERPALRMIGPNGAEIQRVDLDPEDLTQRLTLDFPADGQTGTYALVPANLVAPMSVWVVDATLEKRVVHAGDNWIAPVSARAYRRIDGVTPRSFFFLVPAGTETFRLEFKSAMLRSVMEFGVRNAEDELIADWRWQSGSNPDNAWQSVEFDAGQPEEDEAWSLTCGFQAAGETYVRLDGIPSYVASSPDDLFAPGPAARQPLPEVEIPEGDDAIVYADADLPWGGRAAYLNRPVSLEAADGGETLMDPRQGTVEMWVKTADAYSDVTNRTLLTCGTLQLMRRLNIGTYASIGGAAFHRFGALPNNRWTHLAFTWKPSEEEGADLEIALFKDGVEVKDRALGSGWPHKQVSDDWPGDRLVLPSGIFVGEVRVSGVVRYNDNFARPAAPFRADEDTRLLGLFDGSGEALVLGERVPIR